MGVGINSVIEPSNRTSKSDSGVECLWVGNVPEDPRHTPNVSGVGSMKILALQPRFRLWNQYVLERRPGWRPKPKQRWMRQHYQLVSATPVPYPTDLEKHPFGTNNGVDNPGPKFLP